MAVKRFSTSFISESGQDKSSNFIAGYSPAIDEMDLISRVILPSGGASSIQFISIPQTYQHLQLRYTARTSRAVNNDGVFVKFNGVSANYAYLGGHVLYGNGSSAAVVAGWIGSSAAGGAIGQIPGSNANANVHGAAVVDLIDYISTNKTKVGRTIHGYDNNGSGEIHLMSFFWNDTSAISSMEIFVGTGQPFVQHSIFSLYGVKA